MYYWHWLGGHDWWYDWSLIATTSRTINHDWSYISSSPVVSNRTLTRTTNRGERLQMEIVWSITLWSCNQSEQLVTDRTTDRATAWHHNHERLVVRPRTDADAITRDWWYDHVRHVCVLWSQTVLNMTVDWFCSYDHVRGPTTSTISGTFSLRFDSDSYIFRS